LETLSLMNRSINLFGSIFNYGFAFSCLLVFSPITFTIILSILIIDGKPVFYKQERIGKDGVTFIMYKFRTMINGAEIDGPKLSTLNDSRVTKLGKILRKTKLDELPQLWNIIKGEMVVISYRPERKYYILKIIKQKPEYLRLLEKKPGITSLGQVKYGYAESVEQMLERLNNDLFYVKHKSFALDSKILIRSFLEILKGFF